MTMTTANKNELQAEYVTMIAGAGIAYDATKQNGSAHVGKAVAMSAEDTVDLVQTNGQIFGKLIKVEPDGFCVVQDDGYAQLPTDGSTITYTEANNLLAGGATAGTVKVATGATATTEMARAIAIKGDGTNLVIARLC